MNEMNFNQSDLLKLIDHLLDQSISPEQHQRLQQVLLNDATARQEFLAYVDLHLGLRKLSCVTALPAIERAVPASTADAGRSQTVERVSLSRGLQAKPQAFIALPRYRMMALAACLLLMVGAGLFWTGFADRSTSHLPSNEAQPHASLAQTFRPVFLSQSASAKFFGELTPRDQASLDYDHEFVLTDGMIELQFPSGAEAILVAPAVFELASESRMLLSVGQCSVYAPPGAEGFVIDTPLANVVDLGTRFVVDVNQSGDAEVHVVEGEAEVITKRLETAAGTSQSRSLRLREREYSLLGSEGFASTRPGHFEPLPYQRQLPDRIVSFNAQEDSLGRASELRELTIQRGSVPVTYRVDDLIGVELIHYHAYSNAIMLTPEWPSGSPNSGASADFEFESTPDLSYLELDHHLCSGLINPAGQSTPLTRDPVFGGDAGSSSATTPGMAIRFRQPVINGPGPEVVVFELQLIVHPESGDRFHVSPLVFSEGLKSHTINSYDIDMRSPQSKELVPFRLYRCVQPPRSLAELKESSLYDGLVHSVRAKVLAVSIDLSNLGYAHGAAVNGLFFQDAADDKDAFDPVFIAGLPPTT